MTYEHRTYRVGDHLFRIESPKELLSEKELSQYAPFQTDSSSSDGPIFTLKLIPEASQLPVPCDKPILIEDETGIIDISSWPHRSMSKNLSSPQGHHICQLNICEDFKYAEAWIGGSQAEHRYALDTALMLMYAFASAHLQTILIHASAIECDGNGYIFLGKSGTGKSTHSRLWLQNIPGSSLLNDDNPIIRIIDGQAYVYGSPWSGKTPCYKNRRLPLGGIVRLQQAPENRMTPLSGIKAYAALLPSCSSMKWNRPMAEAIHSTISHLIASVHVYHLNCRPDPEAAIICHHNISK